MKACKECGYVEYWGTQAELVCPNCEEAIMQVQHRRKNLSENACKNVIKLEKSLKNFQEKRRQLFT